MSVQQNGGVEDLTIGSVGFSRDERPNCYSVDQCNKFIVLFVQEDAQEENLVVVDPTVVDVKPHVAFVSVIKKPLGASIQC